MLFISHDRDAAQFNAYCREMAKAGGTWLAVQYAGSEGVRAELATVCGVAGIPTLVVIGPDGAVIAHNARQAVAQDATGEGYPWAGATASGGGLQMSTIALLFFVFMILPRLIDALKRWLGL